MLYKFKIVDGNAVITDVVDKSKESYIVPEFINGYKVTRINKNVFKNNTKLKSIILPETIEFIGDSVFYGCKQLRSIIIPDSVKHLGNYIFFNCINLIGIILPKHLKCIQKFSFANCKNLLNIVLPDTIEMLCDESFSKSGIVSLKFPDNIKSINNKSFKNCENLSTINVPENIKNINTVFSTCINIKTIVISGKINEVVNKNNMLITLLPETKQNVIYDNEEYIEHEAYYFGTDMKTNIIEQGDFVYITDDKRWLCENLYYRKNNLN